MRTSIPVGLMILGLAGGCGAGDGDNDSGPGGRADDAAGGEASSPPRTPAFDDFVGDDPVSRTEERGCEKVDFLYVIDNSPSMVDEQENLARSFVGFSRVIEQTLRASDHHIMVVDTDGVAASDVLDSTPAYYGCEQVLGAGVRFSGSGDCYVESELAYLEPEQENVAQSFSCLARVGAMGNVESKPIEALLRATGAIGTELQTCNTGFLRDDAILVVTVITDEDDDDSDGQPEDWKEMLLAAKGGNEQAVVMLGLISDTHLQQGLPGGPCDDTSGLDAPRLQRFAESFELGSVGSVCAPDYSEFFADAVQTIDTACDVFVPEVY
jgi:hypothetical protein